jgi:hypothetical protein
MVYMVFDQRSVVFVFTLHSINPLPIEFGVVRVVGATSAAIAERGGQVVRVCSYFTIYQFVFFPAWVMIVMYE